MKITLLTSALVLASVPLGRPRPAAAQDTTPSAALLVLSKAERVLSIVDPATRAVVARVPAGLDPHEVIASSDGRVAYVSNYGGGAYHTITPVDLVRRQALPVIDLGALGGPHGLTFAGGKLWFTAEGAKAVGRYDPATRQVDWVLGTGQDRTHMLVVAPDTQRVITTNVSSATVTVIDRRSGRGPGRAARRRGRLPAPRPADLRPADHVPSGARR